MDYSINSASIFLPLGLTVFFYLAIPLIISARRTVRFVWNLTGNPPGCGKAALVRRFFGVANAPLWCQNSRSTIT